MPPQPELFGVEYVEHPPRRGGMATVYKARYKGEFIAVKIPNENASPDQLRLFELEAKLTKQLHYPLIPSCVLAITEEELALGTRWVDGLPLDEAVRANRLGDHDVVIILCQVCETLAYLRAIDVVHGDITTQSIIY